MAGRLSYTQTYKVTYSKSNGPKMDGTLVGDATQSIFYLKDANGKLVAKGEFLGTIREQGFTVLILGKKHANLPVGAGAA